MRSERAVQACAELNFRRRNDKCEIMMKKPWSGKGNKFFRKFQINFWIVMGSKIGNCLFFRK